MPSAIGFICAMLFAFGQGSTNVSGKWVLPQAGRNGARGVTTLTLNQAGPILSGSFSGAGNPGSGSSVATEIFGGKVDGDTVTFYVWRGSDRPAKQFYKGVVHGDEIDFTVTGGPTPANAPSNAAPAGAPAQITAKRTAE